MSGSRTDLVAADFRFPDARRNSITATSFPVIPLPDEGFDFHETLSTLERTILEQALFRTRGNKAQAAQMLRMKRTTLSAKVRALSIGDGVDDEEEFLKVAT